MEMAARGVRDEDGFTLVEILFVVLVIGVLAAIALPAFASQESKAYDAAGKANARNMALQVESCYVETSDYTACTTSAQLPNAATGLPWGAGPGQVRVTAATLGGYTIQAVSNDPSGAATTFQISRANGVVTRDCGTPTVGVNRGHGGCDASPDARGNYW
jgi:type IV pilus assembly protein PilA